MLNDLKIVEVGGLVAVPQCGRMLADLGAEVVKLEPPEGDPARLRRGLFEAMNVGKQLAGIDRLAELAASADVVVESVRLDVPALRASNPRLVVTSISPFGRTGPRAAWRGCDLNIFHAAGYGRVVGGPVDDPNVEPPLKAAERQADFVAGVTAAVATLAALRLRDGIGQGTWVDVSAQEALVPFVFGELARQLYRGDTTAPMAPDTTRRRADNRPNGTVAVLPTTDGHVAISPREEHLWRRWLEVMGSPAWANDARFADRASRAANWPTLEALLADWTRTRCKADIAAAAQALRVPAFPVNSVAEVLRSPQLAARGFFADVDGQVVPTMPYRFTSAKSAARTPEYRTAIAGPAPARRPLAGVRVVELTWVIAGPLTGKYLASLGAEVIRVESDTRAEFRARGGNFALLNDAKRSVALDMTKPRARGLARQLVLQSDVLVENFGFGAVDRLGLGYEALAAEHPGLVVLSCSGLGRTGPDRDKLAYGTLLQLTSGWSLLQGNPAKEDVVIGGAWTDPLTAAYGAFAVLAALRARDRTGRGCLIDLSMVEATLSGLPESLAAVAREGRPPPRLGNRDALLAPHGVYPCRGEDAWVTVAATTAAEWRALAGLVGLDDRRFSDAVGRKQHEEALDARIAAWTRPRTPLEAAECLQGAGVPAAPSLSAADLLVDPHLAARGMFPEVAAPTGEARRTFRAPWLIEGFEAERRPAPRLGQDNAYVLGDLLRLSAAEIAELVSSGVVG